MHRIGVGFTGASIPYDMHRTLINLAAQISQKGQKLKTAKDVLNVLQRPSDEKLKRLIELPHPTMQKFTVIPMIFFGVSRRFLAQITRHQNEIKFMVSSFRYADHTDDLDFVTPIEVLRGPKAAAEAYEAAMLKAGNTYKDFVEVVGNDAAGYLLPNATRCTILASATPYEWKHIIRQRTCRRAGLEMRYVMLNAWAALYSYDPIVFSPETTGAMCMAEGCREGGMSCGNKFSTLSPFDILADEFGDILELRSKEAQ
jgi:thymidylate synthase (FAD)